MRRLRTPAAAAAVTLALGAAGCGGGDEEPRETRDSEGPALAPAPGGMPDPQAFQRFEQCLRDNGVKLPEGPPAQGEPPPAPPREAMEKCERHLPEGAPTPSEQPQVAPLR